MSYPPDDALVDRLDRLFSRIAVALDGAFPGDPAPEPETEPSLNSEAKPPDGAKRDEAKSRKPNSKPFRSAPPNPDKAAMRAALDAMFDPDEVVELRAIYNGCSSMLPSVISLTICLG